MQKKIIALAVAGLVSGAAFAQSNVTIYGIADAGYAYSQGDNSPTAANVHKSQSLNAIQSGMWNGSRLGFKGEEALGNGLKAVFTLEYALNIDTNNGIGSNNNATSGSVTGSGGAGTSGGALLQSRQTFVGLGGNWGTATLGRQYAPGFLVGANDAMGGATNSVWNRLSTVNGQTITPNSAARWNNSVNYVSPNFSGFTARAIYGFGENVSSNTVGASSGDGGGFGLGGNYQNGGLNLDLIYQGTKTSQSATASQDGKNKNEWYIGGAYDFKVVKISGSYQAMNRDDLATGATKKQDSTVWQLGISAPIGANGLLMASGGQSDVDNAVANQKNSKTNAYSVAYSHSLSKRTSLYTGIVVFDNNNTTAASNGGTGSVVGNNAVGAASGVAAGFNQDNTTFMAGVLHKF